MKVLKTKRTINYKCFPGGAVIKNLPAPAGDTGLIPELGRSSGEGDGNSLHYSYLENSMDRGAWRAPVHVVTKNQPRLNNQAQHIVSKTR